MILLKIYLIKEITDIKILKTLIKFRKTQTMTASGHTKSLRLIPNNRIRSRAISLAKLKQEKKIVDLLGKNNTKLMKTSPQIILDQTKIEKVSIKGIVVLLRLPPSQTSKILKDNQIIRVITKESIIKTIKLNRETRAMKIKIKIQIPNLR